MVQSSCTASCRSDKQVLRLRNSVCLDLLQSFWIMKSKFRLKNSAKVLRPLLNHARVVSLLNFSVFDQFCIASKHIYVVHQGKGYVPRTCWLDVLFRIQLHPLSSPSMTEGWRWVKQKPDQSMKESHHGIIANSQLAFGSLLCWISVLITFGSHESETSKALARVFSREIWWE